MSSPTRNPPSPAPPAPDPPEAHAGVAASSPLLRWINGLNVVLALTLVFFACLTPIYVTDFWWQAKTGELILRSGHVPTRDPFSWTAHGQPWQVHEWLTEVFFYTALAHLPQAVLLCYKCGLAALAAGLVLWRTWGRSGSLFWSVAAAVTVGLALRTCADLRPQMISLALAAGLLLALDRYRAGGLPRLPWALPVLFAVWANLHGGVVVGLALLLAWLAGEAVGQWLFDQPSPGWKPLALSALVSMAAAAANPSGFSVYTYPFYVLGHPRVQDYISEWFAPNFHTEQNRPVLLLVVLTVGALPLLRDRAGAARWGDAAVLASTLYAGLTSQRNTVLFALAAAPVTASALAALWRDARPLAPVRAASDLPTVRAGCGLALAAVLGVLAFRCNPPVPPEQWFDYAIDRKSFPEKATALMKEGMWPGRLYNDYIWGGYLIWNLYPQRPVFIDGRAEVYYRTGAFDDEMTLHTTGPGWQDVLQRRGVEVVLTGKTGALAAALSHTAGWRLAFTGPVEAVYTRDTPAPAPSAGGAQ